MWLLKGLLIDMASELWCILAFYLIILCISCVPSVGTRPVTIACICLQARCHKNQLTWLFFVFIVALLCLNICKCMSAFVMFNLVFINMQLC